MSILSEVPFGDVKMGDLVKGANGVGGSILRCVSKTINSEDNEFLIRWDDGNHSLIWHFWCDQIQYLGPKTI